MSDLSCTRGRPRIYPVGTRNIAFKISTHAFERIERIQEGETFSRTLFELLEGAPALFLARPVERRPPLPTPIRNGLPSAVVAPVSVDALHFADVAAEVFKVGRSAILRGMLEVSLRALDAPEISVVALRRREDWKKTHGEAPLPPHLEDVTQEAEARRAARAARRERERRIAESFATYDEP